MRNVELYKFVGPNRSYFYTSAERDFRIGVDRYVSTPISRSAIRTGDDEQVDVQITLPFSSPVVQDYAYLASPPALHLEIWLFDRNAMIANGQFDPDSGAILWSGEVAGWQTANRLATARVPSDLSRVTATTVTQVYYQKPCNHKLYGSRCKVDRASFTTTSTVTSISGTQITVADDGVDDNFLNAGVLTNTRTGERRLVISNQADVIIVALEFSDLEIGDPVELTAGCDHSLTTCQTKFNNTDNYGGFPFIPANNPFRGGF